MVAEVRVIPVTGMPDVQEGENLASLIVQACQEQRTPLQNGDILVVTQKIVSKAEGMVIHLAGIEPSEFARQIAREGDRDPRHMEVVLRESRRIVKMDRGVLITETHHGFICANAGVDASNVGGQDLVSLLPKDPDGSAQGIRQGIRERLGLEVAVIISDTFNRPWRMGTMNVAIGVAGINPLQDHRGVVDPYGYQLRTSVTSLGDELASSAEMVMGKVDRVPVAIVRGVSYEVGPDGARQLLRAPEQDLFR